MTAGRAGGVEGSVFTAPGDCVQPTQPLIPWMNTLGHKAIFDLCMHKCDCLTIKRNCELMFSENKHPAKRV